MSSASSSEIAGTSEIGASGVDMAIYRRRTETGQRHTKANRSRADKTISPGSNHLQQLCGGFNLRNIHIFTYMCAYTPIQHVPHIIAFHMKSMQSTRL